MNHNKDNRNNTDQSFEKREGKHSVDGKKYVVGGVFFLLAILLLAAIFSLKNT